MSDTAGMVRLMEHAAERLNDEAEAFGQLPSHKLDERKVWVIAAMALAEGVLRMVARSAAAGDSAIDTAIAALADYPTWAGRRDDAAILDIAELKSIERYFRTMESVMTLLALPAAVLTSFVAVALAAAVIGHRRAHRRQNEANEIERIEAGLTVELPLIRPAWPQPEAPRLYERNDVQTVVAYPLYRCDLEPELRYLAARPPVQPQHRAIEPTPGYVPRHALPEHEVQVVAVRSLELDRARVEEMAA